MVIQKNDSTKDAKADLLKYMAWMMHSFPSRMVLSVLQMTGASSLQANQMLKEMQGAGELKLVTTMRYWGDRECVLSPALHLRLLKTLKGETGVKWKKYPKPNIGIEGEQWERLRGEALYWLETGQLKGDVRWAYDIRSASMRNLLQEMARSEEWRGFYSLLPEFIVVGLLDGEFDGWLYNLEKTDSSYFEQVYRENKLLSPEVREYLGEVYSLYEYVLADRLSEIPRKVTMYSGAGFCAHALYAQCQGEYSKAVALYQKGLKCEDTGGVFSNVFYMTTYAIALMREGSVSSRKKMGVLLGKKDMREDSRYMPVRLILGIALEMDTSEVVQWIERNYSLRSKLEKFLLSVIVRHYGLSKIYDKDIEELGTETYCSFLKKFDSLLVPYCEMAPWEKALQTLDKLIGDGKTTDEKRQVSQSRSRIVYHVNRYCQIIPRLQKSKDGITWSKGRNIALATFQQQKVEGMTQLDARVAECVKSYNGGYSIGMIYELGGPKVFALLAGYPFVYRDENPEVPVVIMKEEPNLVITKRQDGYEIKSNVDKLDTSRYVLKQENDQLFRVMKVDAIQRPILEAFKEVPVFPEEAKERLTNLLEKLGKSITVHSDLIQNNETLKQVKGESLITVQLQPVGEGVKAELYVKPFAEQPPYCKAGEGAGSVIGTMKGKRVQAMRNLKKETRNLAVIQNILRQVSGEDSVKDIVYFDGYYQCLELIDRLRGQTKISRVEWPEGVKLKVKTVADFSGLFLSLKGTGYWFEVDGELEMEDGVRLKIAELLKKVRQSKGRFVALNESDFLALSKQLRKYLEELDARMTGEKKLKISAANASLLIDLEQSGASLKKDEKFAELQKRIEQAENARFEVPATLQAELRSYQRDGFQWLSQLAYWGAGACLADDMGLGKTIQAIALLLSRAKQGASLVIAPTSVLLNWQSEINRFAPSLNCLILHVARRDREKMVREASAYDILLTTYGVLVTEDKLLASRSWNVVLLDEAHTIKNKDTKMSKAAMTLNGDFRLLLTGTPIQNHLSEIWNLFQFANPGLLGAYSQFSEDFIFPIEKAGDKKRQKQLRNILRPFLLRRTKAEVLDELPQKTEIAYRVELSFEELALYENLRQRAIANLEEGSLTPMQTLAEVTRLRQAACHPALVDSKIDLPSSKTQAFLKLVDELIGNNHRSLVFSQFTSHLALIRKELEAKGIPYLYLDGSMPARERENLVQQFQQGEQPLFLISLKAGGTGLNLTAADYVIHLDPWWNPAVEDQASDRAYRIGQTRPVTIYRLIAAQTIEEKIVRLHQSKKSLADSLLDGSNIAHKLTKEEMLNLLKGDY